MTNNQLNQIYELTTITKAKIGVSKIDGVGVIALFDIKKDDQIFLSLTPKLWDLSIGNFSHLPKEVRELILGQWPTIVNGSKFLHPSAMLTSYLNHSDDPNYNAITDTALRDIKTGEEVTVDYKKMENFEKVFKFIK